MERSFVMVKPDGVQRQLIGEILARFERKGFRLAGAKFMNVSVALAKKHYAEHEGKSFFGELVDFMTSGPVVIQVLEGENAVAHHREVMGATDPAKAADGTVRKLFAQSIGENSVHGSDSEASAEREINFFFRLDEIVG